MRALIRAHALLERGVVDRRRFDCSIGSPASRPSVARSHRTPASSTPGVKVARRRIARSPEQEMVAEPGVAQLRDRQLEVAAVRDELRVIVAERL